MSAGGSFASWRLKITDVPRNGRELHVVAKDAERADLANALNLHALDALDLDVTAWPWGKGGVKLTGELHASVVQLCVVTFRPVSEDLAERFVRTYLPQREIDSLEHKLGLSESVEVGFDMEDPPEPLHGSQIDLREIILEELTLALNPYPRHPDAENAKMADKSDASVDPGPFDVLKKLTDGNEA